jgi:hypothetical protein
MGDGYGWMVATRWAVKLNMRQLRPCCPKLRNSRSGEGRGGGEDSSWVLITPVLHAEYFIITHRLREPSVCGLVMTAHWWKLVEYYGLLYITTENIGCLTKLNSLAWVRQWTVSTGRPPLVRVVSAKFCGYKVPRGQRDGSLRPYSRLSRPEPLYFLQVAP